MYETMLTNEISQRHSGKVFAVGQRHAILQVVDGKHDHCEPFLSGFEGLLPEIAQAEGIFQVSVIDFHRPAFLVVFQGLFDRQRQVCANKILGELVPGAFFGDDRMVRLGDIFQAAFDKAGVILGSFLFVHSIERDLLIMLVPER